MWYRVYKQLFNPKFDDAVYTTLYKSFDNMVEAYYEAANLSKTDETFAHTSIFASNSKFIVFTEGKEKTCLNFYAIGT